MRLLTALLAAAVAGCASAPDLQPSDLTNVQLCEAFFYAGEPFASRAGQEATNRGVRCPEYRDAVAQYRQNREAAGREASAGYLLSRPITPTVCRSVRVGATVQTVCN